MICILKKVKKNKAKVEKKVKKEKKKLKKNIYIKL